VRRRTDESVRVTTKQQTRTKGEPMKLIKCTFQCDKWGLYITPLVGYSNTDKGINIWFGWLKWLYTIELKNK